MSPPVPGSAGRLGEIVDGRYRLERELGSGAMGVVYEALDLGLDRRVALKIIDGVGIEDVELRRHFQREARALARLEHEHVVRIHELGTHGPALFFAMELIRGRTLAEVLDAAGRPRQIPLATGLQLLDGVADGLDAVHRAGLVHRDVKPKNVVVEEGTERPVLVDFGLALELREAGQTHRGGTPEYMAPELSAGNPASQATDVYAFACTAFEVLTGQLPFWAPTVEELFALHAAGRVPNPSTFRHGLVGADPVLRRGLAKDPALRPASCRTLVADVRAALETSAASVRVPAARIASSWRAPPPSHDGRVLILVLDEDATFARACGRAAGAVFVGACHLVVGETLHGAASRLGDRGPHLAIVDLDDPGGVDAIAALRAMPGGDRSVMVGITASSKPPQEARLAELGVLDVLRKPLAFDDLVAGLRLVARRRGLRTPPVPPACGAPIG